VRQHRRASLQKQMTNIMSKYFYTIITLIIISCNQSPSQVEKDYIKNLEEKNRILEQELQEIKSKLI
jgi:hypothetical protein